MKRFLSLLLIVVLLPNIALAGSQSIQDPGLDLMFFEEVLRYIEKSYPYPIEESVLIQGGLKGMLQSVDPYSDYYTPEEADEIYKSLDGEFSGIGVYIEEKDGYIKITDTIKNQPAEKAGLKKDDLIISIDGTDIKGLGIGLVSSMIKGPAGSKIKLGIKRGEKALVFELLRSIISIKPIEYRMLDKDIAYIQLLEFTEDTGQGIAEILASLNKRKVEKIILDLRDNPGGLLTEAIDISKLLVPKGPVVHIREKDKRPLTYISTEEKAKYKLVVLVNENTASASEIVAGAIKEREVGKLVGGKTFGKGIVQSMLPLRDGSLIKLTTAEYLLPSMTSIHGKGIEPDYMVENTLESDLQLQKAIEVIKQ